MQSQTELRFRKALLDPTLPVPDGLTDGKGRPAGRRYAVYRNTIAVSLREALETGFPACRSLVGAANFAMAAQSYLRAHPPTTPIMQRYGADFPDFLGALPQLGHLGYLSDVARLELAIRHSYHAEEATPVYPASYTGLREADLAALRLPIAPATRIVTSPWPVLSIHRFALDPAAPKPSAKPQDVLITRPEFDPVAHLLPQGAAPLIAALACDLPLAEALEHAPDNLDLPATLSLLLSSGALGHPKGNTS